MIDQPHSPAPGPQKSEVLGPFTPQPAPNIEPLMANPDPPPLRTFGDHEITAVVEGMGKDHSGGVGGSRR
jgi:hypothetical protein